MVAIDLLKELGRKGSRGSKPRCHLVTHGDRAGVAEYLAGLTDGFAGVTVDDIWMPSGFEQKAEVELHKRNELIAVERQALLAKWWLPPKYLRRRTPNFDIASTCTIDGERGLILVEAKAHFGELEGEEGPRPMSRKRRKGREHIPETPEEIHYRTASHITIGRAIEDARIGLSRNTGLEWGLDRDACYQMSNRFAWAWKLTELGIPVILVYLGFLDAADGITKARPFRTKADWVTAVKEHSASIVPPSIWGQKLTFNGKTFAALVQVRTCERPV